MDFGCAKILNLDLIFNLNLLTRVAELVDALDSGSSVHCGRAGSSPVPGTYKILNEINSNIKYIFSNQEFDISDFFLIFVKQH